MITYCTNIHPAESWQDIFRNVRHYVPAVKKKVSPNTPFPIGLRVSGQAAGEIDDRAVQSFLEWCEGEDVYVATINGFPYGTFHHVPIKEEVYLPDWRQPERFNYTKKLATLLSDWLPITMNGSISTVPIGFKNSIGVTDEPIIMGNLEKTLECLDDIAQRTGKKIVLSVEPEPGCALETTNEVVHFFNNLKIPSLLKPFLALCYDCCHQALQFESPRRSLQMLKENNINIGHVQVSSALHLKQSDIKSMGRFEEPCYLHQTVGRLNDGSLVRYNDLDKAIHDNPRDVDEWRIHFHVPVFINELDDCSTTQPFLKEILPLFDADIPMEVETYTWEVLPPDLQMESVIDSIVREIEWVKEHRGAKTQ